MNTDKSRASNRRNSQLSTGPITERGRTSVRSNALTHGFYAKLPFDDGSEDPADYSATLADFLADLRPAGAVETELTHRYVAILWKLRRFERLGLLWAIDRNAHSHELEFHSKGFTDPADIRFAGYFEDFAVSLYQFKLPGHAPVERISVLENRLRRAADGILRQITHLQADRLLSIALAAAQSQSPASPSASANPSQPAAAESADYSVPDSESATRPLHTEPDPQPPTDPPPSDPPKPAAGNPESPIETPVNRTFQNSKPINGFDPHNPVPPAPLRVPQRWEQAQQARQARIKARENA